MSLKQRVTRAVDKAFDALDDLVGPMTITYSTGDPTHDPNTGVITRNEVSFQVQAAFDDSEIEQKGDTLVPKDARKILVKPVTGMTPRIGGTCLDQASNVTYSILRADPVIAYDQVFLWELMV